MKQKYTIRVADIEMNVISEESPEAVEALVGIVDRKMREIEGASKRCSKSEAALLCALDYCGNGGLLFLYRRLCEGWRNAANNAVFALAKGAWFGRADTAQNPLRRGGNM